MTWKKSVTGTVSQTNVLSFGVYGPVCRYLPDVWCSGTGTGWESVSLLPDRGPTPRVSCSCYPPKQHLTLKHVQNKTDRVHKKSQNTLTIKLSYLNSTQPTDFHHQILKLKTYPENQFWILYGALQGKGHIDVTAKIQYENQRWESESKRIRMLFPNKDEEEKKCCFY